MNRYETIMRQAAQAAQRGDVEAARGQFREAITLDPERVDGYYDLAVLSYQHGRMDEAVANFEQALSLDQSDASIHNNLGALYYAAGRLEDAKRSFGQAIQLRPGYRQAVQGWNKVCQKMGKATATTSSPGNGRGPTAQTHEGHAIEIAAERDIEGLDIDSSLPVLLLAGPSGITSRNSLSVARQLTQTATQFTCQAVALNYRQIAGAVGNARMNTLVLNAAAKTEPALVLVSKGEALDPETLRQIKRRHGAKVVVWYADQVCSFEDWFANLAGAADLALLSSNWPYQFEQYKRAGVENLAFLPVGADPDLFQATPLGPGERERFGAELTFIGRPWPWDGERQETIRALIKAGIVTKIWSPVAWGDEFPWQGTGAFGDDYLKVHTASDIVFNMNSRTSSVPQYMSNRYFFSLACGSFTLVKYVPGIEEFFENHRHLVWFHNPQQAVELARHYLERPEERARIAQNARQVILDKHTLFHRLQTIFEMVSLEKVFIEKSRDQERTEIVASPKESAESPDETPPEAETALATAPTILLPGKALARPINKVADFQDMNQIARRAVCRGLMEMKMKIERTGLPYSDHMQDHWLRLWEYSLTIIESTVDTRMRVLDAGGTGTPFSYHLASEGCDVYTVDINEKKLRDAHALTSALGLNMHHDVQSITSLRFPDAFFDRVFCICVIEHLPIPEQPQAMAELARVLKPGGILAVTFDYGAASCGENPILNPTEIEERLISPSELAVLGHRDFSLETQDLGGMALDHTFGSLFLAKPGALSLPVNPEIKFTTGRF